MAGPTSARGFKAVIPDDNQGFPQTAALYVGATGDVVVRGVDKTTDVSFKAVPAGSILPLAVTFVKAAGTTAGDIVALY